jgi:hypothetical protein
MIAGGTEGGASAATAGDAGLEATPLAGGADPAGASIEAAPVLAQPAAPAISTPATNIISQIPLARLVMRRSIPVLGARRALE